MIKHCPWTKGVIETDLEHHVPYLSISGDGGTEGFGINQFAHEVENWLSKLIDLVLPGTRPVR